MRDRLTEFETRNVQVMAVLPQEPEHLRVTAEGLGVKYVKGIPIDEKKEERRIHLLADPTSLVGADYGVAFQEFCATANRPATFVIDRRGVLRWEHRAKENAADRPSADQMLAAIDQLEDM